MPVDHDLDPPRDRGGGLRRLRNLFTRFAESERRESRRMPIGAKTLGKISKTIVLNKPFGIRTLIPGHVDMPAANREKRSRTSGESSRLSIAELCSTRLEQ